MNDDVARAPQSPELLLAQQVQLLDELRHAQADQQTLLAQLLHEQEAQRKALADALEEIKVADFNMPFVSLVGFLVKASLAAIPASIILAILGFIVFAMLGGGLFALGS
ncbi:MAG: hypothetical protein M5U01_09690 [Ardenticatenaceae bacterium]|nr:hypothetical protein [Ardenticatenaceae bacterium]